MRLPVLVTGMVLAISGLTGGISGWSVHQFQDDTPATFAGSGIKTAAEPIDERCAQELSCAITHYQRLVRLNGLKPAIAQVAADTKNHQRVHEFCHDLFHVIGEAALDLYWPDFSTAFSAGPVACGDGYHHGVISQAVLRMGRGPELLEELPRACAQVQDVSYLVWECYHGIGHAFYVYFKGDMRETFKACMSLDGDRNGCVSGATMGENAEDGAAIAQRVENPFRYCEENRDILGAEIGACYSINGTVVAAAFGLEGGMRWCNDLTDTETQRWCWDGVSRNVRGGDVVTGSETEKMCLIAATEEGQEICARAVATNNAAFFGNAARAMSYCDTYTTSRLAQACRDQLENSSEVFTDDETNAGIGGQFGESRP